MKFLASEHKAFKSLIEKPLLDYETFSFVKKKGWLNISHEDMAEIFRFHRKDESSLDAQGHWIISTRYSVSIGTENLACETFEEVLRVFESWLAEVE